MVCSGVKLGVQASSVTYNACKDLVLYMKDRASYIRYLEENMKKLGKEIAIMNSRKKQTDSILEVSLNKEPTEEYRLLVGDIKSFKEKFNKFIDKYEEYHQCEPLPVELRELEASSFSLDFNAPQKTRLLTFKFWPLAKLSKRIVRLHDYIFQLNTRVDQKNLIMEKKPDVVQVKHNDDDFAHFNGYAGEILNYLKKNVNRVGISGPIGIGKTTVMRKLNNELDAILRSDDVNNNLKFDYVIWVDFPESLHSEEKIVEAIQEQIMLRLKINKEMTKSTVQNSYMISDFLSEKKYILLMDQVSAKIDLEKVGIREKHENGKVVVAAKIWKFINQMNVKKIIEVQALSNADAWKVLEEICGQISDTSVRNVGDQIINSCGGVLLVIKLVGGMLKSNINASFWKGVKNNLTSDPKSGLIGLREVGNAYEMMYEQLEKDHFKKCALYGALFPERHKIYKDYLIECWKAEGFFDQVRHIENLRDARDEGKVILNELAARYLLEEFDMHVKMPVYFRMVALELDYPDESNSKMLQAQSMHELSKKQNWGAIKRMTLIGHSSSDVPAEGTSASAKSMADLHECPVCNDISTLLLQFNPKLETLETNFFLNMKSLKVLDLHQTGIKSLPSSMCCLVNLVSLYLNECYHLAQLPPDAGKLLKLEVLDIRGTSIYPWLPQQIGEMVNLRCLRVSFDHKMLKKCLSVENVERTNPCDIFSNLKQLEELSIETVPGSKEWVKIADPIAIVLASLEKLTTLQFNFSTVDSLQNFVSCSSARKNKDKDWGLNTFRSFRLFAGCDEVVHPYGSDICGNFAEKHLRFSSTDEDIASIGLEVLNHASAFELIGSFSGKSLNEFKYCYMTSLKVCVIEACKNIETIVNGHAIDDIQGHRGEISSPNILPTLAKLILYDLPSLQYIWKGTFLNQSLSKLSVLKLCKCPELIEITAEIWELLEKIVIIGCGKLSGRFMTRENAHKLVSIECEISWWSKIQLLDEEDKTYFGKLCSFVDKHKDLPLGAPTGIEESTDISDLEGKDAEKASTVTSNVNTRPKMSEQFSKDKCWQWRKKTWATQIAENGQEIPPGPSSKMKGKFHNKGVALKTMRPDDSMNELHTHKNMGTAKTIHMAEEDISTQDDAKSSTGGKGEENPSNGNGTMTSVGEGQPHTNGVDRN